MSENRTDPRQFLFNTFPKKRKLLNITSIQHKRRKTKTKNLRMTNKKRKMFLRFYVDGLYKKEMLRQNF